MRCWEDESSGSSLGPLWVLSVPSDHQSIGLRGSLGAAINLIIMVPIMNLWPALSPQEKADTRQTPTSLLALGKQYLSSQMGPTGIST